MEITDTIQAKSDQINAVDLISSAKTITIESVKIHKSDQPVDIFYGDESGRCYRPSKSMRRVIAHAWGEVKENYIGRSMTLYCDPNVMWGGKKVGGIKISHMTDIEREIMLPLTERRGVVTPHKVKPLVLEPKQEINNFLIGQGDVAASAGTAAYKKFLSELSPEEKAPLKSYHKKWSQIAKEVDTDEAEG